VRSFWCAREFAKRNLALRIAHMRVPETPPLGIRRGSRFDAPLAGMNCVQLTFRSARVGTFAGKQTPIVQGRTTMLRLIAVAVAGLALTASPQALTPAPLPQLDGMITQVRFGCGPGRTLVAGHCVARTIQKAIAREQAPNPVRKRRGRADTAPRQAGRAWQRPIRA
jgi:hypothetical protein